jgi:hypothetical protein
LEQTGVVVTRSRDLGAALREADWDGLLPRLVAHAEWRLRRVGWAAGEDTEPTAMTVQHVINTAIERCLEGRRTWSDSYPDLETFLKGVIDNLVWTAKKGAIRDKADAMPDAGVDVVDERPSPEDALVTGEDAVVEEAGRAAICAAFEACVEDDPTLQDLYLAILLKGVVKREDIARVLGWTVEEVSGARIKLKRRLLSRFPEMFAKTKKEKMS